MVDLSTGPHVEHQLEPPGLRFVSIRVKPAFKATLQEEADAHKRSLQNEVIEMLQESLRRRSRRRARQGTAA